MGPTFTFEGIEVRVAQTQEILENEYKTSGPLRPLYRRKSIREKQEQSLCTMLNSLIEENQKYIRDNEIPMANLISTNFEENLED